MDVEQGLFIFEKVGHDNRSSRKYGMYGAKSKKKIRFSFFKLYN